MAAPLGRGGLAWSPMDSQLDELCRRTGDRDRPFLECRQSSSSAIQCPAQARPDRYVRLQVYRYDLVSSINELFFILLPISDRCQVPGILHCELGCSDFVSQTWFICFVIGMSQFGQRVVCSVLSVVKPWPPSVPFFCFGNISTVHTFHPIFTGHSVDNFCWCFSVLFPLLPRWPHPSQLPRYPLLFFDATLRPVSA